jgi:Tol biopolymer transport system component
MRQRGTRKTWTPELEKHWRCSTYQEGPTGLYRREQCALLTFSTTSPYFSQLRGRGWTWPRSASQYPYLSRDGKTVAFRGLRGGNGNVWESSLSDGHEVPIIADDYARDMPQWSPDGTRLAYWRQNLSTGDTQLMVWSSQSRNEEPLTESSQPFRWVYDWSPDGKWLLMTENNASGRAEIWLLPVAAKLSHCRVATLKHPDCHKNVTLIPANAGKL